MIVEIPDRAEAVAAHRKWALCRVRSVARVATVGKPCVLPQEQGMPIQDGLGVKGMAVDGTVTAAVVVGASRGVEPAGQPRRESYR